MALRARSVPKRSLSWIQWSCNGDSPKPQEFRCVNYAFCAFGTAETKSAGAELPSTADRSTDQRVPGHLPANLVPYLPIWKLHWLLWYLGT